MIQVTTFAHIADLITGCAQAAQEQGFSKIGVVAMQDEVTIYSQFGFEISQTLADEENDTLYLIKTL